MYSDLRQLLLDNNLLIYVELGKVPGSSCVHCRKKVIDFNAVKAQIASQTGILTPKSVNALAFTSTNRLMLIQTETSFLLQPTPSNVKEVINALDNGDLHKKISGTIEVIGIYLNHIKKFTDFQHYFLAKQRDKITTTVGLLINDRDMVNIRLASLDKLNIRSNDDIIGEIQIMSCEELDGKLL